MMRFTDRNRFRCPIYYIGKCNIEPTTRTQMRKCLCRVARLPCEKLHFETVGVTLLEVCINLQNISNGQGHYRNPDKGGKEVVHPGQRGQGDKITLAHKIKTATGGEQCGNKIRLRLPMQRSNIYAESWVNDKRRGNNQKQYPGRDPR